MPPTTPLLLVDNVFDTVTLYPTGTVSTSSERAGHEGHRVASYRRERQSWQPSTVAAGHSVQVDLGAATARAVDFLFLDRGHNLWGKTLLVKYSTTGAAPFTTYQTLTVPAAGTLGGDPASSTMAVTEEGACYAIFTASVARRAWQVLVVESMQPVVTGLLLGLRNQLLGYSNVFDEDAGERTEDSSTSRAGYRGTDKPYSWRTLDLGLAYIGATEYDSAIRTLRTWLFDRNQPAVILMDYGTRPERGWMYQLDGKAWGLPKTRVYRSGRLRFREVGASLT
jgi:hypothetical protein